MAKINLLAETATATCTGIGTYVYSKIIPPGEVWRVRVVCVSAPTNYFTVGHIGIYNGVTYRPLEIRYDGLNYEGDANCIPSTTFTGDIYVKQGDRVYGYVTGESEYDTLTLEVYGEILQEE